MICDWSWHVQRIVKRLFGLKIWNSLRVCLASFYDLFKGMFFWFYGRFKGLFGSHLRGRLGLFCGRFICHIWP